MEAKMNAIAKDVQRSFKEIGAAWSVLDERVGLGVIRTEKQYKHMVALADQLIDQIGSNERGPLAKLLEVVGTLIEQYEADNLSVQNSEPCQVLNFLMQQHDLKQSDLRTEVGSQGVVSEILNGKREINARQAKSLAERFGVSPAVFL